MRKNIKHKKYIDKNYEVLTEEQHEEYLKVLYGLEFIAGFTESGVPYGLFNEDEITIPSEKDEEFPF